MIGWSRKANVTKKEALDWLSDGHTEYSVEGAKKVCQAFGLELPESLIDHWTGQADANPTGHPKGLWLEEDTPGEGVSSYRLSNWVTEQLGVKAGNFYGRGTQARSNAEAVKGYLKL